MSAQQARIEADRLLEQVDAFWKAFLLEPDGTQYRGSHSASLRIGKSQPGLLICLLQPSCLNQSDRFLEGLAGIGPQLRRCTQEQERAQRSGRGHRNCMAESAPVTTTRHRVLPGSAAWQRTEPG